jgi:hypothetical protein
MAEHASHTTEITRVENWDDMPAHRTTYQAFTKLVLWASVICFIVAFGAFAYWYRT